MAQNRAQSGRRTAPVLSAAVKQMMPILDHIGGVYLHNAGLNAPFVHVGGFPLPLQDACQSLTKTAPLGLRLRCVLSDHLELLIDLLNSRC